MHPLFLNDVPPKVVSVSVSVSRSVDEEVVVVVHAAVRAIGCPPQPDKRPRRQQVRLHRPRAKPPNAESISVLTSKTPLRPLVERKKCSKKCSAATPPVLLRPPPGSLLHRTTCNLVFPETLFSLHGVTSRPILLHSCQRQPLDLSTAPASVGSKVKDSQIHLRLLLYLLFFLHLYLRPLFEILRYL